MVAPPDHEVDSVFAFDGVIGYHFIRDAKEIIIDNEAGKFVFPKKCLRESQICIWHQIRLK